MKWWRNLIAGLLMAFAWGHGLSFPESFRYVDDEGLVFEDVPDSVRIKNIPSIPTSSSRISIPISSSSSSSSSSSVVDTISNPLESIPLVPPLVLDSNRFPRVIDGSSVAVPVLEQIPEDIQPAVADPTKMTRDELFQLAFKKPPAPRSRDFMVRLFVDDKDFGDIQVLYNTSFTGFNFYSMPFSHYLDTLLSAEARKQSNGIDGHFNSNRMDSLGFAVGLDERNYELKIYVPPEMKLLQRTSLGRRDESHGILLDPAFFSFYMNMQAGQYARCSERLSLGATDSLSLLVESTDHCDRDRFILDLEGATAFQKWILEGSGKVIEPNSGQRFTKKNLRRNDFRLIREFYNKSVRLSVGDIGGVTEGLMRFEPLGGLRYEFSPRFFGRNIFQERYKIRFLLPRPAQVEVQMDGKVIYQLRLPSGSHELSGFSGRRGMNVIQIFMTQEDGSFSAIPYTYELGDSRNLLKDEVHYSTSVGVKRLSSTQGYDYHSGNPGANGSWLYGLTPTLTGGVFGQGSLKNVMLGAQLLWSSDSISWWEFRGLTNYIDSSKLGHRQEIEYNRKLEPISFSILGSHQTHSYNPDLFGSGTVNIERFGVAATTSMSIPRGGVSLHAGASFNRRVSDLNYSVVDYNYGANVSQNLHGVSLNASATATVSHHVLVPFVSLSASYVFGVGKHNFVIMDELARRPIYIAPSYTLTQDSASVNSSFSEPKVEEVPGYTKFEWKNSASLGWNWSDGGSINGARSYSANITHQDDFSYGRMWAQHYYNRAKISASYNLADYDASYLTQRSHTLNANAGTSIMFADGVWAFGRPVDKGFILAKPQNGLTGSSVHINHSDYYDADFSQSGWLGAAYYNQITNYRPNEIQISLTDVPMGSWLEQDRYYTMGAYKQGYAVRLGSAARVLMRVRLIDETKQPMDYVYVTVGQIDENGNMMEKRATFTSKDGVLQMGNLHPGHKYRIHFGADSYIKDIDVMVPRGSGALFTLPDIQVEHKQLDMSMTKRSQASLGKPQPPAPAVEKPSSLPLPMQVPTPAAPVNEELPPSIAPPASANY